MNGVIPPIYKNASLDDFPETSAARALVEENMSLLQGGGGMLIQGPNGVGKTHLACAVASALWGTRGFTRPGVFLPGDSVPDVYVRGNIDAYRDQEWVKTLSTCRLLILDDLGKEDRGAEWRKQVAVQRYGSLLRARVQNRRTTFITTNLSDDELVEMYGPSIDSLLHEACGLWFQMTGKDRRKAGA